MAEWRDFNATNEPDTCLWCGRKLRRPTTMRDPVTGVAPRAVANGKVIPKAEWDALPKFPVYDKPGDYGDGYFCGLRCAYMFGVEMASMGRRLTRVP